MAGLTLGGGYGPLIGRRGLALDNLVSTEVVLADGRIIVADRDNEPEPPLAGRIRAPSGSSLPYAGISVTH
jgi:FAD/FMN-containing dehydrogenase